MPAQRPILYCYWVGSLGFKLFGFPTYFLLTSKRLNFLRGDLQYPSICLLVLQRSCKQRRYVYCRVPGKHLSFRTQTRLAVLRWFQVRLRKQASSEAASEVYLLCPLHARVELSKLTVETDGQDAVDPGWTLEIGRTISPARLRSLDPVWNESQEGLRKIPGRKNACRQTTGFPVPGGWFLTSNRFILSPDESTPACEYGGGSPLTIGLNPHISPRDTTYE